MASLVYSYFAKLTVAGTYVWYKPWLAKVIKVTLLGAGGGGEAGSSSAIGYGGCGGACVVRYIDASILPRTVSVVIGAGGAGGTGGAGMNGSQGANTTFGSYLTAYGGGAQNVLNLAGTGGLILPAYTTSGDAVNGLTPDNVADQFGEYGSAWIGTTMGPSALYAGGTGGNGSQNVSGLPGYAGGIRGSYSLGGGGAGGAANGGHAPSCVGTYKAGGGGGGKVGIGGNGGIGGWGCGGGGGGAGSGGGTGGAGGRGGCGWASIAVYW